MSIEGWYYLHTNGDLIYKVDLEGICADIRESSSARAVWAFDSSDRLGAWTILIEAKAHGANAERIRLLAEKWGCNDQDAELCARALGVKLFKDGDHWCCTKRDFQNLQESPSGFGVTALDAFASLAKELGLEPSKMWGTHFKDLAALSNAEGDGG